MQIISYHIPGDRSSYLLVPSPSSPGHTQTAEITKEVYHGKDNHL